MPTKRPDELPEGEDFNFEDIMLIEKDPNALDRKLYKTKLRELMRSALKMDPERIGENAILGMQSKFDWLITQMEKISENTFFNVEPYQEYDSETKTKELQYVTPTPSPTPSITPTPSRAIDAPIPSQTPTPTPTPSSLPETKIVSFTISDFHSPSFELPEEMNPIIFGYSNWELVDAGGSMSSTNPDSFQPSILNEELLTFRKLFLRHINSYGLKIETALLDDDGNVLSVSGLKNGSSITFRIKYS